ncbi:MAG: transposase [Cyanosarcina radialis HA8281-LM2]|nr:transposase [Cyanosarcina radialis HA8281-LM2]
MSAYLGFSRSQALGYRCHLCFHEIQSCVKCGHTSRANRPNQGLLFRCECCNFELHADLLGSRNIALRTLLARQDWMSTGILSVFPDGSKVEAKADSLQRFSELRWTSGPSSVAFSAE